MPYEIHAYCASNTSPTIRELLTWLRDEENGWGSEADAPETSPEEMDSSQWEEFFLRYRKNSPIRSRVKRSPMQTLTFGCYRNSGKASICAKMAQEQLETIAEYKDSPGKQKVADCLARTQFMIWCRVDNDSDRKRASQVLDLLASMLEQYDAVFNLEDEGYLADSDTPLCGWCANDE